MQFLGKIEIETLSRVSHIGRHVREGNAYFGLNAW